MPNVSIGAGKDLTVYKRGQYFACFAASAAFEVSFDGGPWLYMDAGMTRRPNGGADHAEDFETVVIRNPAGATNNIAFDVAGGWVVDNRFAVLNDVSMAALTTIADAADVSCAPASQTQIVAANMARKSVTVKNLDAAQAVRIGADPGAAKGFRLDPGQHVTFDNAAEIKVYNPGSGAVVVSVTEEL